MSISAKSVHFDDSSMWVELSDGRTLGVPFAWFPRLLYATPEQRERVEIGRMGLHWEEIDEDISIAGLLAGEGIRRNGAGGRGSGRRIARREKKPVAWDAEGSYLLGVKDFGGPCRLAAPCSERFKRYSRVNASAAWPGATEDATSAKNRCVRK